MREIMRREPPPKSGNFFELTIGELEEVFKLPNFATRQELLSLYAEARPSDETSSPDLLRAMAATLGACWWGREKVLESDAFEFRNDLIRYGDLVLSELEAEGFSGAEIIIAGSACVSRVVDSIPQEQEVKEKEAFSKAEAGA